MNNDIQHKLIEYIKNKPIFNENNIISVYDFLKIYSDNFLEMNNQIYNTIRLEENLNNLSKKKKNEKFELYYDVCDKKSILTICFLRNNYFVEQTRIYRDLGNEKINISPVSKSPIFQYTLLVNYNSILEMLSTIERYQYLFDDYSSIETITDSDFIVKIFLDDYYGISGYITNKSDVKTSIKFNSKTLNHEFLTSNKILKRMGISLDKLPQEYKLLFEEYNKKENSKLLVKKI